MGNHDSYSDSTAHWAACSDQFFFQQHASYATCQCGFGARMNRHPLPGA